MQCPRALHFLLCLQLLFIILQCIELVISALFVQQLLMIALLQNFSVRKQNNIIGMLNGGKSVSYHQHSTDVLHFFQGILDQHFRFRIDVGGCLIQNHYGRLVDNGTGEA